MFSSIDRVVAATNIMHAREFFIMITLELLQAATFSTQLLPPLFTFSLPFIFLSVSVLLLDSLNVY